MSDLDGAFFVLDAELVGDLAEHPLDGEGVIERHHRALGQPLGQVLNRRRTYYPTEYEIPM